MCRKCLCTRFEHAIHVLVALWHYARHCCSAVLSLYDRLCSLLSALLSLTRGRVTRVFCIPFCFSLSICFFGRWPIAVGAKLRRIYGKSTARDASPTRASRPSTWSARNPIQILHDRHRQVLHDRYRYHRHNLHQRQDYDTATARRPSPWPEALRCDSGQCDRLVERRLRISDCPLSQNDCSGGALNYHPTFFIFGNTTSDPTKHTPCPGPRPLTYAALNT